MSEMNDGQPLGWVKTTLSEVASASRAKAEPGNFGNVPYIGLEHIEGGSNRILDIGRVTYLKSTKSIFQSGDVLYGKLRPYLKKVCRPDFDGVCSTDILVFPESPNIDNGYLLYFLSQQSTADYATQNSNGINLPRISSRALGEIEFPLPPLAEQRRIAAKIEALQERSRRAREALSEVGSLLEQFRQSVLAAAFRGDPTADWRAAHPNVEPASELLHRIRAERRRCWEQAELAKYEAKGQEPPKIWKEKYKEPEPVDASSLPTLPNGWEWVRVKSVGEVQLGRQRSPQYHSGPNMCPYLRVMNVFEDRIDTEDIMKMDFSPEDFERYRLEPGDILLNEGQSRELVGRSAIYRGEVPGACFTNTLVRFRPDAPIESDYPQIVFLGYLKTGRFQQLAALTVNIAHLGAGRFADMEFPLPPLEEQAEIVRRARGALDQITRLEQRLHANLADLEQLDEAILAKAFRGELVPQDPGDEPASVLLERIRAQRKRQAKAPKQTSKTHQTSKLGKKSSRLEPQQLTLAEVLRTAN